MDWILILELLYLIFIISVCLRIIFDTDNVSKTLGYLLVVIFLPIIGVFIYFSFGVNYRKNKLYTKKITKDKKQQKLIIAKLNEYNTQNEKLLETNSNFSRLAKMLYQTDRSPLTCNNSVELLINGEEKFPAVIQELKKAKNHIHIEYYIYEDDDIGKKIEEILISKAQAGVEVRFIYDDFGSSSIRKHLVKRLLKGGVRAYPFYKIKLIPLANRINYRNHRKIIVIDGLTSFVGGINISDKYSNATIGNKLYWRDTHLKLKGPITTLLQRTFIADWNFCSSETLPIEAGYFPAFDSLPPIGDKLVQIAASGPDSDHPTIYYSIVEAILSAKKEVFLTSPYFIPGETIMDALIMASLSGVKIKLLLPGISDSFFVNAASRSYFKNLLQAGVEIYLYQKGFVHAKTLVADRCLSIVGTANLDYRSFDLNFEVNAVIYDEEMGEKLAQVFEQDLLDAKIVDLDRWLKRPKMKQLLEKTIRLISPLL
ncbi:cardiolipin synthase [Pedobacter sp. UYP30]|uniref:cardiolipin synthase n=1 Tax=Pedobacter sp. UYP30 TaxID=1756400 RepID=UPI003397E5A8